MTHDSCNSRFPTIPRRIRSRLIVGKGLALSAQHTGRHGKARANALHACGFAQGRRESRLSLPEGASPFPTGKRLRIRPKLRETRALLHGAPGSARPTGERLRIRRSFLKISPLLPGASGTPPPTGPLRMRRTWWISFGAAAGAPGSARPTERMRIRLTGCSGSCASAWNAGAGVPYRAHPQNKASTSKRGLSHQGGPLFSAPSEKFSRRGWSNAPARVIICQIFMDGTSI